MPICAAEIEMPLPSPVIREATAPTMVTSRPSRIHAVPSPRMTCQWNWLHGRRSSREGIFVSMVFDCAVVVMHAPQDRASLLGHAAACSSVSGVPVCRVLGHDFLFTHEDTVMRWSCRRGCGAGGAKTYDEASQARRYTEAFNAERSGRVGERAPLIATFPLRLWARLRRSATTR